MTSQEFRSNILSKRPRYNKRWLPLMDTLANKGAKSSDFSQFGPYYEIFVYAMMLGIKKDSSLPLPPREMTTDFLEIGKWKRDSALVDFLLSVIFSKNEELGFEWNELEDMEPDELSQVISKVVTFMEEYANGGLEYLNGLYEKGELDSSHYMFIDMYNL